MDELFDVFNEHSESVTSITKDGLNKTHSRQQLQDHQANTSNPVKGDAADTSNDATGNVARVKWHMEESLLLG